MQAPQPKDPQLRTLANLLSAAATIEGGGAAVASLVAGSNPMASLQSDCTEAIAYLTRKGCPMSLPAQAAGRFTPPQPAVLAVAVFRGLAFLLKLDGPDVMHSPRGTLKFKTFANLLNAAAAVPLGSTVNLSARASDAKLLQSWLAANHDTGYAAEMGKGTIVSNRLMVAVFRGLAFHLKLEGPDVLH